MKDPTCENVLYNLHNLLYNSSPPITRYPKVPSRHRRQAADLPTKVAKRIGCAYKRDFCVFLCRLDCSLEIGWSPIFVKILGHN